MKILVACEESQAVTIELRKLGHEAYSCDIETCSGGHPEWHIQQDVAGLLNGRCYFRTLDGLMPNTVDKCRWDMIIAFPPCTHLAVSGAKWFKDKRDDGRQREGIEFFCKFLSADCDRIAIENPVGIIGGDYIPRWFPDLAEKYELPIKPSQIIQPWMFGDHATKSTCLWLKGLKPLVPDITEKPEFEYHYTKSGKRMEMWIYNIRCKTVKNGFRAKMASKTFPGIAKAMAEQWAGGIDWTIVKAGSQHR